MKKIIILVTMIIMTLVLVGCGNTEEVIEETSNYVTAEEKVERTIEMVEEVVDYTYAELDLIWAEMVNILDEVIEQTSNYSDAEIEEMLMEYYNTTDLYEIEDMLYDDLFIAAVERLEESK